MVVGASLALAACTLLLVAAMVPLEAFHVPYDDEDAATVAFIMLVCAPIIGAWWRWVRS